MPFNRSRKGKKSAPKPSSFPILAPSSVYSQQTNFPSMPTSGPPPRRPSSAAFFRPLSSPSAYSAVGANPFAFDDDDDDDDDHGEASVPIPAPTINPNPVPVTPPQPHHRPSSTAFFKPLASPSGYSSAFPNPFGSPEDNRPGENQPGEDSGLFPPSPCSAVPAACSPDGASLLSSRPVSPLSSHAETPISRRPLSPFTIPSPTLVEPPVETPSDGSGGRSGRSKTASTDRASARGSRASGSASVKTDRTKTSRNAQTPRDSSSGRHTPKDSSRISYGGGHTPSTSSTKSSNTTSSTKSSSKSSRSHKCSHTCTPRTPRTCRLKLDPSTLSPATKLGIWMMGTTPEKLARAAHAQREKKERRERERERDAHHRPHHV
ncbi:hypothetical protein C8A05DRAFT_33988 [Staphylotrichum tortipilum]|uniref:Uncharacterized protein n=1 Tax=Staphylotrichum tortipilum TaxID=2831512 RepID=A0AAN6RU88_9PEZI|nr:hypothetical protein C8A05DRAFT_33988 [Staphylotrichum longicolle]